MERKTGKLGAALLAAALGVGVPALACAQTAPDQNSTDPDNSIEYDTSAGTGLSSAIANIATNTQQLANMGTLDEGAIMPVSMSDMGLDGAATTTMAQQISPSDAATLQTALQNVNVTTQQSPNGVSLANYLSSINVDPHSVVAVDVADGGVTVYYH